MRLQSLLGVFAMVAIAWALSENRRAVSVKRIAVGLAVTVALALLMLQVKPVRDAFAALNGVVDAIAAATRAGTSFVFGYLGGGTLPFDPKFPGGEFIFAFQALPVVLVMSVLTTLLFYWKILPPVVQFFAWALRHVMFVGGAVGVSTAANIFVGQVEGPLFVRPYLSRISRGELFILMTGGMAGIAGTVMVLYATIVGPIIPDAFGHILIASVLGAPAAIVIGQVMVPDPEDRRTGAELTPLEPIASSTMDAIVKGTEAGIALLINIIAMLVVLVALVHLTNAVLALLPTVGGAPISLQRILGTIMAPIVWLIGIPWAEAETAGALMGVKTILNEFIAYVDLSKLPADALSPRSRLIMLYAMCGFANFGSLGIMIGGLGVMVPDRRAEIVALGLKSIVSGTLSTLLLGAIVGLVAF
jgi:CNT family concentrative nucleoside transporter